MPFPFLIPALISAGASIWGAAKGAGAAKTAAGQQVAASNRAADVTAQSARDSLDFQKQMWAQSQANMKPWLQYGGGALKTLGDLMGIAPDTSIGANAGTMGDMYSGGGGYGGPGSTTQPTVGPPPAISPQYHRGAGYVPNPNPARDAEAVTDQRPTLYSGAGPQPPVGPAGGQAGEQAAPVDLAKAPMARTVRIAWPDGSTNEVPSEELNRYLSAGAEKA